MAFSNYDATTTNKSKRSNRIYSDLNLSFTKNPATKDVAKLFDVQAIKRSVKNIILTSIRDYHACPKTLITDDILRDTFVRLRFYPLDQDHNGTFDWWWCRR